MKNIDENYLLKAINIRRTYLKLMNNMDLYGSKAKSISDKLTNTLKEIDNFKDELKKDKQSDKINYSSTDIFNNLLKIIDDVSEEGKRLEKLIEPINIEIEKLAKEEMELYKQIVDNNPDLTSDEIVDIVQNRLLKEGLS
jgi:predicted  nucleic acid-binding Zn-ribbon protein